VAATAATAGKATSTASTAAHDEHISETSLIHRQRATRRELKIRVRRATR
jgi:hypothetical protein